MDKIEVNIIDDILKSRIALFNYGKPVQKLISKRLQSIASPTLFVLNLKRANPMDYKFINVAFSDIINRRSDPNIFVVFKIDRGEFEELCYGIIDILRLKINTGDSEKNTLVKNGFSMIYEEGNSKTQYLSSLSDKHLEILAEIEKNENISSSELQEKFSLIAENTTEILSDLLLNKFIIKTHQPLPQYISIKSFI